MATRVYASEALTWTLTWTTQSSMAIRVYQSCMAEATEPGEADPDEADPGKADPDEADRGQPIQR